MPQRIPWDEDESLILLDALLQVLSGGLSREDAVASVSKDLRMRAIHRGIAIDDIFRNQNGIHFQMSIMEYIYTDGKRGLKKDSMPRLFRDTVFLYKNDRPTYQKRLAEAKASIESTKTVQKRFFEWLAEEVPSEQTAELYANLQTVCADIEQFCIQEGTLERPLFETTDTDLVGRVLSAVESNETVQSIDEHRTSKLYSVLYLYHKFLIENGGRVCTQVISMDSRSNFVHNPPETVAGPFQVDFNCIGDMAYTYPLTLEYAGKKTEYHTWNKLYVALVSQLRANYEFDTDLIVSEEMKSNFRNLKAIGEGLYIEVNCSATRIVNNIQRFLKLCNVDFSSVVIQYARRDCPIVLKDNQSTSPFSAELLSMAEAILSSEFVNGMRKNAAIARKKFRRAYLDLTGEEFPESVDIDALASAVGVEYADKFYVVSKENQEKLRELISTAVGAGNRVIFYEELYQCHLDFMAQAGIFSADLLKTVLKRILPDMRYRRAFFSLTDDDSLEKDIISCYGDSPMRTYGEIKACLPYADLYQIRMVCSRSGKFVWAKDETYALADRILLSPSDISDSLDTVMRDVERQGFSVFHRIPVSESAEWNPCVPEAAVREAMYIKHLAPLYQRNRSIITLPGASFSAPTVMVEYCRSLHEVTLSELQAYEEELTDKSLYSLSAAYDTMLRVDWERFVGLDMIEFDVQAVDDALALFVQDRIVPLGSVKSFTSFPEVDGYPWNLFLLDSFCKHKSRRFRTMGGPAKSKPVGAIFPMQMQFEGYDALLARVAAESGLTLHADDVGAFFAENAYTLRRIETGEIINRAQEIRIQEGIADV